MLDDNLQKQALCLACLKCCHILGIHLPYPDNADNRKFWEARGFTPVKNPNWNGLNVVIEMDCPHLTKKGCDIYSTRPKACRDYDGRIDPFMNGECMWGKQ